MIDTSAQLDDGASLDALLHGTPSDPRAYLLRFYPGAPLPPLDDVDDDAPSLPSRVQHGLWVAACDCGRRDLPSGGIVWLDRPLVWCPACSNAAAGGRWRRVTLPGVHDRAMVAAVLLCRPDPATRNWQSDETIAELIAQNVEHGDPVPVEV